VFACSSTSSEIEEQGGTDSKPMDQKKRSLPNITTLSSFKQTFSGIEDFFLLREGKVDSLKSSTNGLCTPPSKGGLFQSNALIIYKLQLIYNCHMNCENLRFNCIKSFNTLCIVYIQKQEKDLLCAVGIFVGGYSKSRSWN